LTPVYLAKSSPGKIGHDKYGKFLSATATMRPVIH